MATNLTGSCMCGVVQYEIDKRPRLIVNCHCTICRKGNGSAFSTYASVLESSFSVVKGADSIQNYPLGEKGEKNFCGNCGSPLFNKNNKYPGFFMVHYGSLNIPNNVEPTVNVFFENKLPWVCSIEQLKNFEQEVQR
ncbi:MAG: GFA family protein [Desulfuromusa sp.]|nr:GFA family protein [Desulfuromusa sp.]